jgi:hypothetical protein
VAGWLVNELSDGHRDALLARLLAKYEVRVEADPAALLARARAPETAEAQR